MYIRYSIASIINKIRNIPTIFGKNFHQVSTYTNISPLFLEVWDDTAYKFIPTIIRKYSFSFFVQFCRVIIFPPVNN